MKLSAAEFIRGYIETHEGGLSLDKDDTGNWYKGALVGSKFGVTGAALAAYRGTPDISAHAMALLTIDEAVNIGLKLYYHDPHLDLLPWDPVTASVLDMAWGAGPGQATKLLQRMIGVADDGKVGRFTAAAYAQFVQHFGIEETARKWGAVRNAFYDNIIAIRPANAKYRNGWRNRTASFLPGTDWWRAAA